MDFMKNAMGDGGIAKKAGQKAGELVEDTVSKVLSGKGEKKEQGQERGNVQDGGAGAGGEGQKEQGGSFGLEDALTVVGGKKDNKGSSGGKNLFGGLLG